MRNDSINVNCELGKTTEEAVVVNLFPTYQICTESLNKLRKSQKKIASFVAEIWTEGFPNTKHNC
jgi:hypothetical protein